MDMISNDVLAFVKDFLVGNCKCIDNVLLPRVTHVDHSASIEVSLTYIVVRIDERQVFLQVFGSQSDVSADVIVAICRSP